MSLHLQAQAGEYANIVLMPGDPLRGQRIAEQYLSDVRCVNRVRNMLGFTGTYQGQRISVQASGMGMPSMAIYAHELIHDYGVKTLIRLGSAGGLQANINLYDIIIAEQAYTDSAMFHAGIEKPAAHADSALVAKAQQQTSDTAIHTGSVFTTDSFYHAQGRFPELAADKLAIEMETYALYTLAAQANAHALSLVTVSDHLLTQEQTSKQEREENFMSMVEMALGLCA